MQVICAYRGEEILVDDWNYERLSAYRWRAKRLPGERITYAITSNQGKSRDPSLPLYIKMHRLILGLEGSRVPGIDHKNWNGLDNQEHNLRIATPSNNMWNRRANLNNTSGYKGVTWDKSKNMWFAQIQANYKDYNLGHYDTPEEAHAAYCAAAQRLHGEFASF